MRKGSKMSEEAKRKISEWNKANNRFRGQQHTEETRALLSERAKNSDAARAHRERLAASRKGKPRKPFAHPEEHSANLSKALKGKKHHVRRRAYHHPAEPIHLDLPVFNGCIPAHSGDVAGVKSIYAIVNTVTGKVYVGSANDTEYRWFAHKHELKNKRHHSPSLQCSWDKHGEEAFLFRLLEIIEDREQLLDAEQIWIDRLQSSNPKFGYNINPRATCPGGPGESNGRAKLTEHDVADIRCRHALGDDGALLARQYGVSKSTISSIILRKTWAHIP